MTLVLLPTVERVSADPCLLANDGSNVKTEMLKSNFFGLIKLSWHDFFYRIRDVMKTDFWQKNS